MPAVLIVLIVFSTLMAVKLVPRYLEHIEKTKELEVRRLEALSAAPEKVKALQTEQDRKQLAAELLEAYDELEGIGPSDRKG